MIQTGLTRREFGLLLGGTLRALLVLMMVTTSFSQNRERPRARELGVIVGVLPPGPLNSITDVAGVAVGHTTIVRGNDVRTGVTAILPHTRNLFREKVRGAVFVGNAFGKLTGSTQVNELGEIETPILLTSTLAVPRVADAVIDYMLALPGNEDVRSINPLVGETNDATLNDIRGRHITSADVVNAIKNAMSGANASPTRSASAIARSLKTRSASAIARSLKRIDRRYSESRDITATAASFSAGCDDELLARKRRRV